ncbi:putative polysaccharide biosynthesis protein [Lederbergia graminis]|uniref:putative polysaccharide biosynthesis protein n=1 Tax=Lederbergia graminis TaxID=735518 RepID=UPI0036D3A80C
MLSRDNSNHFIKSALILTAAAFIVKILSAIYRVPFQNIVGDVGFYIYQQVYPIYGIAIILATSGFPVIISKLAAESEKGKYRHLAHGMQAAFYTLLIIGVCLFSLFFFGADIIARLMGDVQLSPLIKITAFIFLLLPFYSVGRGYFQSYGDMVPTASSQVLEQIIRVSFILIIAILLVNKGSSLYAVGSGAMFASLFGGISGFGLLCYYAMKRKAFRRLFVSGLSFKKFYKTAQIVLIHGTAICISGMLLVLLQLVDSFSIYSLLRHSGMEMEQAKVLKGIFDRGQPLIQLGTVVASSFSLALVPLIASAWRQNNESTLQEKSINALNITIVISVGATIGLVNIMKPTNIMLFANSEGSNVLAVLAVSILFSSFILVSSGILHGLGHVFAPGKYILLGVVCKTVGNVLLIPLWGTMGAALATIISLFIIMVLMLKKLNERIEIIAILKNNSKSLLLAAIMMTIGLQIWLLLFELMDTNRFISSICALTGVVIGAFIYLFIIIKRNVLSEEEFAIIPFGNRILQFISSKK